MSRFEIFVSVPVAMVGFVLLYLVERKFGKRAAGKVGLTVWLLFMIFCAVVVSRPPYTLPALDWALVVWYAAVTVWQAVIAFRPAKPKKDKKTDNFAVPRS